MKIKENLQYWTYFDQINSWPRRCRDNCGEQQHLFNSAALEILKTGKKLINVTFDIQTKCNVHLCSRFPPNFLRIILITCSFIKKLTCNSSYYNSYYFSSQSHLGYIKATIRNNFILRKRTEQSSEHGSIWNWHRFMLER